MNSFPLVLNILCTSDCSFNCIHCYIHDKEQHDCTSEKLLDKVINILEKYPSIMFCHVSGGEPLLYKYFEQLWITLHSRKLFMTLSTNLSLYNAKIQSLLEKYPPWKINASLYGFSEETYYLITGVRNIRDTVYKNLSTIKLSFPQTSIYVKIPMLSGLWQEVEQIVHFCEQLKLEYGFVTVLYPPRNKAYNLSQLLIDRNSYFKFFMNQVKKLITMTPFDKKQLENFQDVRKCSAWQQLEIKYNGEISNCLDFQTLEKNDTEFLPKVFFSYKENCVTCEAKGFCSLCNAKISSYKKVNFVYQDYYCWTYKKIVAHIRKGDVV